MKGFVFALTACFLIISTHNNAFAQAGKITAGVSMAMGGFSLDGNPDDTPITDRNEQQIATYTYGNGTDRIHSIIRDDFIISDMILCETAMNELIKKVIDLNYPGVTDYPVFEFPEMRN